MPFAYLIPTSKAAAETTSSQCSQHLLRPANTIDLAPDILAKLYPASRFIIVLDLNAFRGHSCITFGSSRHCHFTFSRAPDVETKQFAILVQEHTGHILVTDFSRAGMTVSTYSRTGSQRLKNSTWPALAATTLAFGDAERFSFILVPTIYTRDDSRSLLDTYADSIHRKFTLLPPGTRRNANLVASSFVHTDTVIEDDTRTIGLCTRMADGALYALKLTTHVSWQDGQSMSRQAAIREAQLLKALRHPNIFRLVAFSSSPQRTAMITEYAPHLSLTHLLMGTTSALEINHVKSLARQSLYALQYLHHRGVTHKHLSTDHILVFGTEPLRIKICGFGAHAWHKSRESVDRDGGDDDDDDDGVHNDLSGLGITLLKALQWGWCRRSRDHRGHLLAIAWSPSFFDRDLQQLLSCLFCVTERHNHGAGQLAMSAWLFDRPCRKRSYWGHLHSSEDEERPTKRQCVRAEIARHWTDVTTAASDSARSSYRQIGSVVGVWQWLRTGMEETVRFWPVGR